MGIASRHAGAPYVNGETLSGTDLELDINNIYAQVNGNLDNSNIATGANIAGSKLLAASITGTQLAPDVITLANLATSASAKYAVTSATGLTSTNGTVATHDVEGLSTLSVTPGAATDLLICSFVGVLQGDAASGTATLYFGISVNGVDTDLSVVWNAGGNVNFRATAAYTYFAVTGVSSTMSIKARYRVVSSGQTMRWSSNVTTNRRLAALVIPIKV